VAVPHNAKLLIVISDLAVGGTERQVATLATELVRLGWAVTIYSFADGKLRAQLERNNIKVILVPGKRGLMDPLSLVRILSIGVGACHLLWVILKLRPKIMHCFLPAAYLIAAPLAFLARVPVRIMSRRSLNNYQKSSMVRLVERRLHRSIQAVLGNSRKVVEQLSDEGVPQDRLGLIYNGFDCSAYANAGAPAIHRAGLGIAADAFVMCIVANLIPYKGHRELIAALGLSAPKLPVNWHLLVVGRDDGIGGALKEHAAELGLLDRISFLGAREDIPAIFGASDVGLLCSHEEGFSNAILEGMASGVPMIVTDVGGNAEAVINGVTGLVVPAHNPARLADAIVRLALDSALRLRFGDAGRLRVIEHFGLQPFVHGHDRLYCGLLDGKRVSDIPEVRFNPSARATIQA
jgi:glycosyltransferase involved in cell wall biosynthesis